MSAPAATTRPSGRTLTSKLAAAVGFVVFEFGPLAAFWILSAVYGVKVAIVGSILAMALDALWRKVRGVPFTRLYLLTSGLTLVFGAIDLMSAAPFMLKYEAAVTNAATGAAFVAGAFGEKPLIQEVAERRRGEPFPGRAEVRRFFQLFTLFWAAYFFVKAGFYVWTALTFPLAEAMAVRSAVGGASLAAMMALSITQGQRLFWLCRWLGLLPPPEQRRRRGAKCRIGMTISPSEAGAMLAEVDAVVAKVKRSRMYRRIGDITILWGAVIILGHLAQAAAPRSALWSWHVDDALGVAATLLVMLRGRFSEGMRLPLRLLGAFALFFGFGFVWSGPLGHFGPRELVAFWPTLFLFGYALASLWLGVGFAALGVGISALTLAGYFWAGPWLGLWLAVVDGGGFILCGLWMRRS